MPRRSVGTGGLVMMLVIALAAIGIGFALWSKILTIEGTIHTGDVDAIFVSAFTDDDDFVDDDLKDSQDTGDCPISVGPDSAPGFPPKEETTDNGITSCDPAATGRDTKDHYDKDVGRCDAAISATDPEAAALALTNVYPSYHCTAWFDLLNNGTIPIHLHGVLVAGVEVRPCESGASTPLDLDVPADGIADVEICVSELQTAAGVEDQCDPRNAGANPDDCQFDLDIHILQEARQDATYNFSAEVCVHQWNEEPPPGSGFCGPNPEHACVAPIIDCDGFATALAGAAVDREVAVGDPLHTFPVTGSDPRCGLDMFDRDSDGDWTFGAAGDDLHCEAGQCPTSAGPDADHDLGLDCVVLDIDGSFVDAELVDCDLDVLVAFGASVCPTLVKWHDTDGNDVYDSGEDIVYDTNGDGIFND